MQNKPFGPLAYLLKGIIGPIVLAVFLMMLTIVSTMYAIDGDQSEVISGMLYVVAVFLCVMTLIVPVFYMFQAGFKRIDDAGLPKKACILLFVPFVDVVMNIVCLIFPSKKNRDHAKT